MSKTPEESIADLRKARDAAVQELEAIKKRPAIPDDVVPLLAEFDANDSAAALRVAIQAAKAAPTLQAALQQKEIALQEYDITKSDVWQAQYTTPATQARQSVITALADARIDPTGKPVITNQPFIDAAMAALVNANTADPVAVKAVLVDQATKMGLPAPDLSTVQAVASALQQLSGIVARGEEIKKTWVSTKAQREAEALRQKQLQEQAALDSLLSDFDVHAQALNIPGIDAESVKGATTAARALFQDVPKKPDVAASALAKAALFDQLITPFLQWRTTNKLDALKVQAQSAPPAALKPSSGVLPATVVMDWKPALATAKHD